MERVIFLAVGIFSNFGATSMQTTNTGLKPEGVRNTETQRHGRHKGAQ